MRLMYSELLLVQLKEVRKAFVNFCILWYCIVATQYGEDSFYLGKLIL